MQLHLVTDAMLNTTQGNDLQLDADVTRLGYGWGGADSAGYQGDRQDGAAAMECTVARRVLVHDGRASLCGCGSSTAARWPLLSSRLHVGAGGVCAAILSLGCRIDMRSCAVNADASARQYFASQQRESVGGAPLRSMQLSWDMFGPSAM